ncbi:SLOG family protein [Streptomyces luteireticuli]|uniref:YspA cpYpsA-related SLOG domain-containing protein n=1 Tax=Streptomyces luteireticuli TaxID=173858 RepID=A0ABN0Z963_9ACTN
MVTAAASRVLVCGSRQWPWPDTVTTLLDRAAARYGEDLVIIEAAGTGAARAAHRWCLDQELPAWRHRCHPLTPAGTRRHRRYLSDAERNQRILRDEGPRLALAFHHRLTSDSSGSTADLCHRALSLGIPVWLVPTADPDHGIWLPHITQRQHPNTPAPADMPTPTRTPTPKKPGCEPCPTAPS